MSTNGLTIHIPTPLRPYADGKAAINVAGQTVGEALAGLLAAHAELRKHLYSDDGKLRAFVNVYVNDEDIRYLDRENTPVRSGDAISIVPSIAGGSTCCSMCCAAAHVRRRGYP